MKNAYWIAIGAAVGLGVGAFFGFDYALAGSVIGAIGGVGIFLGMRSAGSPGSK